MPSLPPGEIQQNPDGTRDLLRSFGQSLQDARLKWEKLEEIEAPRFQDFSFFTQREEAVSRVVAALITPWGLHGQGRIFLDLLMEQIGGDQMSRLKTAGTKVLSVNVEERTKTRRRIDIVVAFEDGFNLGIESKIFDADEQPSQIEAYVTELAERGKFLLLYLHGTGGESESIPFDLKKQLIKQGKLVERPAVVFLRSWLTACSQHNACKAKRVSAFLDRFKGYIEHPPEETFMTSEQTANSVVQRILESPQTFESASAIQLHFQQAVHSLPNQLLERLYKSLKTHIHATSKPWKLRRSSRTWVRGEDCPMNEEFDRDVFVELFKLDEWRYIEFSVNDFAWIAFEIGFTSEKNKRFGALYATIGIRKYGPYRKLGSNCECVSKLTAEQEARLRKALDIRNDVVLGFLRKDEPGHDWHWQRYIYEPLLPPEENDHQRLYALIYDPSDRTLLDFADFMIGLGEEVSKR